MTDISLGGIFSLLFPWSSEFADESHAGIIRVFVVLILVVMTFALVRISMVVHRSHRALRGLEDIGGQLTLEDPSGARVRAAAVAASTDEGAAHLWREFDETLVTDGSVTTNAVPAHEFFSPERLAPELQPGRLLGALPSVLTALGLLGTFIGLAVGLNGLNLGDSDVESLRGGIETMVAGAALGFTASVWGVAASLVVTLVEKILSGRLASRSAKFQRAVDHYFEQHSPEAALILIQGSTKSTADSLETLHDRIGAALAASVKDLSTSMQDGVTKAIEAAVAPSMTMLADRASTQTAGVFESLVGQFSDGFKDMGRQQAIELNKASEALTEAVTDLRSAIADQGDAIAEQSAAFRRELAELTVLTEQLVASLDGSTAALAEHLATAAGDVERASRSLSDSATALEHTSAALGDTGARLDTSLAAVATGGQEIAAAQKEASAALASYSARLEQLDAAAERTRAEVARTADDATGTFVALRDTQSAFLAELRSEVEQLNRATGDWLATYSERVSQQTDDRMAQWDARTREFSGHMLMTSQALAEVVDGIEQKLEPTRA